MQRKSHYRDDIVNSDPEVLLAVRQYNLSNGDMEIQRNYYGYKGKDKEFNNISNEFSILTNLTAIVDSNHKIKDKKITWFREGVGYNSATSALFEINNNREEDEIRFLNMPLESLDIKWTASSGSIEKIRYTPKRLVDQGPVQMRVKDMPSHQHSILVLNPDELLESSQANTATYREITTPILSGFILDDERLASLFVSHLNEKGEDVYIEDQQTLGEDKYISRYDSVKKSIVIEHRYNDDLADSITIPRSIDPKLIASNLFTDNILHDPHAPSTEDSEWRDLRNVQNELGIVWQRHLPDQNIGSKP